MSQNRSNKDKVSIAVARRVAHPERYRKQFWVAATFAGVAVLSFIFLGVLPFIVLLVIGAVAFSRISRRNGRRSRSSTRY